MRFIVSCSVNGLQIQPDISVSILSFSLRAIDILTFETLASTLCTTNFDIQNFYMVITLRLQGCW